MLYICTNLKDVSIVDAHYRNLMKKKCHAHCSA